MKPSLALSMTAAALLVVLTASAASADTVVQIPSRACSTSAR
jgi:hypothetical protein